MGRCYGCLKTCDVYLCVDMSLYKKDRYGPQVSTICLVAHQQKGSLLILLRRLFFFAPQWRSPGVLPHNIFKERALSIFFIKDFFPPNSYSSFFFLLRGRIQGGGDTSSALRILPDKLKTELALHVNLATLKKVKSRLTNRLSLIMIQALWDDGDTFGHLWLQYQRGDS